jgi:L-fucose isomerase-like protein
MNPWNRRFTPCLAHALNKDNGFSSACEKDLNALMAMMIEMYLSNKAIYMGNPDVNVKNNTLSIHHSVASLKMHGLDKSNSPYEIDSFTQEGFGATLRHDFEQDEGQPVTMARFDPSATKILVTRGTIIGGDGMDGCGCAQRVNMAIPNGKEFLHQQQNFGHHLAMVFGDYVEDIDRLGELMKYETVAVV